MVRSHQRVRAAASSGRRLDQGGHLADKAEMGQRLAKTAMALSHKAESAFRRPRMQARSSRTYRRHRSKREHAKTPRRCKKMTTYRKRAAIVLRAGETHPDRRATSTTPAVFGELLRPVLPCTAVPLPAVTPFVPATPDTSVASLGSVMGEATEAKSAAPSTASRRHGQNRMPN